MRSHRLSKCFTAALIAAATSAAPAESLAQTAQPGLALNRFDPSFAGDRMFGVQSPFAAGHPGLHVMLLGDYAHNPLVLRRTTNGAEQDIGDVVSNQLFLHLNATLSLWNRVAVNIDAPLAVFQSGDSPGVAGVTPFASPSSVEFGDLRIGLRLRLFGEYHDAFQVALGGYVWVPTGSSGSFVSDESVRGLPQLILGGRTDRVVWSLATGPEIRASQQFLGVTQGIMLKSGAGVGVLLGDYRHLQLGLEANTALVLEDVDARNINAEVLGSVRYRIIDDLEIGAGAGPGLTAGIGTPDVRALAMIAYTPEQKRDRDKDGIPDRSDACPDVPGVVNADPAKNGCPGIKDRDNDGILDADDACPDTAGVAHADPKKNGCPPPKDSDKDGIIDDLDACVDIPGVASDDPKKNGCPLPKDTDGDGIVDEVDACIDIKGVLSSDPKKNGCPPDTDGDGFRDDVDACPNEKGLDDPDPQKRGCPKAVRVTATEIVILEQVQFDINRATIRPVSWPLLDSVAAVLKEHPEIIRLEVQGHTDIRGSRAYNTRLSQNRADSVLKSLVARGIDKKRLSAKGYGPDQPIADNTTEEGRQQNRRVQFKILEKAPPKAP